MSVLCLLNFNTGTCGEPVANILTIIDFFSTVHYIISKIHLSLSGAYYEL
jgi:hypothetical protein